MGGDSLCPPDMASVEGWRADRSNRANNEVEPPWPAGRLRWETNDQFRAGGGFDSRQRTIAFRTRIGALGAGLV